MNWVIFAECMTLEGLEAVDYRLFQDYHLDPDLYYDQNSDDFDWPSYLKLIGYYLDTKKKSCIEMLNLIKEEMF